MRLPIASEIGTFAPNRRLTRAALRRRKWPLGPLVLSTLPVPLMWNRFLAPLWVFIFGMLESFRSRFWLLTVMILLWVF